MNKFLVALVVIQTVLIGAVVFRIGTLEAQTNRIEKAVAAEIRAQNAPARVQTPAPSSKSASLSPEEYEALRLIVREEIGRLAATIETPHGGETARAPGPAQKPALPPAEQARLYEDFENDINTLKARGAASAGEIAVLEQKIGRMSPADRARALSQLSKAISEGSIDAQL